MSLNCLSRLEAQAIHFEQINAPNAHQLSFARDNGFWKGSQSLHGVIVLNALELALSLEK